MGPNWPDWALAVQGHSSKIWGCVFQAPGLAAGLDNQTENFIVIVIVWFWCSWGLLYSPVTRAID